MAILKGIGNVGGRYYIKDGIDFGFVTSSKVTYGEIKLNNAMFIDGTVSTEVSIRNTSGTKIFTVDQDGTISFSSLELKFADGQGLLDANGAEVLIFGTTTTAVNEVKVTNAATGGSPVISASGGDTNIDLTLTPKGTGDVVVGAGSVEFTVDGEGVHDASGNELLLFVKTASAVNEVTVTNAATGAAPSIAASGETNVSLKVGGKGSGLVDVTSAVKYSKTAQTLTGAGAVDIITPITWLVTGAADALTLADGAEGQEKFIVMKTYGGIGTLTPTNLGNGTTITFDAVGDSAHLLFTNAAWHFMGGSATLA
uniref:Putative tail fiber protein n=1 Tax=viral metagenome TaxID=1070528 RepID=A0A6H1ZHU5_9ZZZZ